MEKSKGMLTLVGTPIGNAGDLSQRGLQALLDADVIACEDTRRSLPFLLGRGVKKPLVSYHKHNEKSGAEHLLSLLEQGKNVALVTDAGMPAISDPGAEVVRLARSAGIKVTCAPGPTALTTAAALAGLTGAFCFLGFLPQKAKERSLFLSKFAPLPAALIFYVSPHDLKKDLDFLYLALGKRKITLVREMTKLFEEVIEGELGETDGIEPRGEYVLIVHAGEEQESAEDPRELLKSLLEGGTDKKSAIKQVAARCKLPRDTVYKMALEHEGEE